MASRDPDPDLERAAGRPAGRGARTLPGWVRPEDLPVPLRELDPDDDEPGRRRWPIVLGLVVSVAAFVAAVLWLARDDSPDGVRATPGSTIASTIPTVPSSVVTATALEPTSAPGATTTTASAPVTTAAPAGPSVSIATADPSKPPAARELVVEGPRVTLRGAVGDRAGAEAVVGKVATVLGAGNVAADFAVDPRAQPTEVPVRAPSVTTFAGATNDYTPGFTQLLDTVATLAKAFPAMRVTVYGYTDDQGSAADNRTTAQRRADAAVQALVDRGVDRARLRTVAKGPADPIASNATPDGRLRNRRVELGVVGLF